MAVLRENNWIGQQRLDIPQLRTIESGVRGDFDLATGIIFGGKQPLIIRGFTLAATSIGTAASSIQVVVANSVLVNYNATESGSMFSVPADRANEVLTSLNAKVIGSFTSSTTNYIGVDIRRLADAATSDILQFLNATTLIETDRTAPLARTLDYRFTVSTTDFSTQPNIVPIAIVVTDSSNAIASIVDARQLAFRQAPGGSFATPFGGYSWPGGRNESLTALDMSSGDKSITSQYDWMKAAMTRLQEIGGGEYWYSATAERNVTMIWDSDPADLSTLFSNGEEFEWDGSDLHWKNIKFLFDNSTGYYNTVTDQTGNSAGLTDLADGECIYVDLDRTTNATITAVKAVLTTLGPGSIPGARNIIAWRKGTNIYTKNWRYPIGTQFKVATDSATGVVKLSRPAQNIALPIVIPSTGGTIVAKSGTGFTGLIVTGDGTGNGGEFTSGSGATGDGLLATSLATNGNGITANGSGTGHGIDAQSSGTGAAVSATNGGAGPGVSAFGNTYGITAIGGGADGIRGAGAGGFAGIYGVGASSLTTYAGSGASDGVRGLGYLTGFGGAFKGGVTNGVGLLAEGGGTTGVGISAIGGSSSGTAISAVAGTTGIGVNGVGVFGVKGFGTGATGVGVYGQGSTNGNGGTFLGVGTGHGTAGTGGAGTGSCGIRAIAGGTATSHGVYATVTSGGYAVKGVSDGLAGCYFEGSAASVPGGVFLGGSNSYGVNAVGQGASGMGAHFTTSHAANMAVKCDGNITLVDATPTVGVTSGSGTADPYPNAITKDSNCVAWAVVQLGGAGAPILLSSYNINTVTRRTNTFELEFATATAGHTVPVTMASGDFVTYCQAECVTTLFHACPTPNPTIAATVGCSFAMYNAAGTLQSGTSAGLVQRVFVTCFGRQP